MRGLWLGAMAAALLLPVAASAQNVQINWTRFIDPTENAFAYDVPQDWDVKGGVARLTPIVAAPWLAAVSPDGAMQVFIGDPETPPFRAPLPNQAEGVTIAPTFAGGAPAMTLRYRPAMAFAELYGPNHLAAIGCADARETGQQAMPDLAQKSYAADQALYRSVNLRYAMTPPPHDAGLVTFTCQAGGQSYVAGVIADTTLPVPSGPWSARVMGYLATPDQAPLAKAILLHVLASMQHNPQWVQAMRDAGQNALDNMYRYADQVEDTLVKRSWDFHNMLMANSAAFGARMTASHNAFMAQMQAQSAQRNANFRQYQAQRTLNSWKFDAYAAGGTLYRERNTGEYYEVNPTGVLRRGTPGSP